MAWPEKEKVLVVTKEQRAGHRAKVDKMAVPAALRVVDALIDRIDHLERALEATTDRCRVLRDDSAVLNDTLKELLLKYEVELLSQQWSQFSEDEKEWVLSALGNRDD